jgi:hypothetical protein
VIRNPFRRVRDPTREWSHDPTVPLLAELDRIELCGVGMGDEVDRLSFLGPSHSGDFDYPSAGLRLDVDGGVLEGFLVALRRGAYLGPVDHTEVRPFAGRLRIGGRDHAPLELRGEQDFIAAWGAPYWRDQDEDEVLLFFERPDSEVQVELSLDGVPSVALVSSVPLMADPEQRARYGVTKPWPPNFMTSAP